MKTENTQDAKARFFALYWGQKVAMYKTDQSIKLRIGSPVVSIEHIDSLELTPLSQISDQDAIEVARIFNLGHLSGAVKALVLRLLESLDKNSQATTMCISQWINVVDFLRSHGYYVGDGTEVEFGWVVLV